MSDEPWLMRIESGLAAHFNQPGGPSVPGVMWSVDLKRGDEVRHATVKALMADDATPATRADEAYQARTTMQYLHELIEQGWDPAQQREHTIHIGNPPGQPAPAGLPATAPAAARPWWRFW